MPARVGTPRAGKTGPTGDPRLWGKTGHSGPRLYCAFSPKSGPSSNPPPPSASVCEEYRELIEQGLARGRNGKAIWQDLVSDHGQLLREHLRQKCGGYRIEEEDGPRLKSKSKAALRSHHAPKLSLQATLPSKA